MSPAPSSPPRSEAGQIVLLTKELEWSRLKIQALEERLRLELIRKYGPKSEKLSDNQLQLLDLEPGVSTEEVEAESRREPLPAASPATTKKNKSGKHPGRQELPAHRPRVERMIACTPEQCVCQSCGKDKVVIGYEQSEQLDVEPARYFVMATRREKRACRACAEGVSAAPLPGRIIDKGLVSDRIVIDTIVNKYSDHRVPRTYLQQWRYGTISGRTPHHEGCQIVIDAELFDAAVRQYPGRVLQILL